MKQDWLFNYLNDNKFNYERNIGESEVWRNSKYIYVVHPEKGIQLIYHLDLFNENYTESVIEIDLIAHEKTMASKNRTPTS